MDDEYKKMVLGLPEEFFAGWEWKEGDRFILINRMKGKIVDYQDGTIGDSVLENGEVGYIWTSGYSGEYGFEKYYSEIKPIPSQEQLQTKIKVYNKSIGIEMYDYCLITQIGTWCYRQPVESVKNESIECLTLMFYQWLNDKRWDGEKWI